MLINYLKLALRLMMRNPFFTFINVAGMSIGFTAFYILWPYAQNELKSDQFHKDYERIARLSRAVDLKENETNLAVKLPMHNSGMTVAAVISIPIAYVLVSQYLEKLRW